MSKKIEINESSIDNAVKAGLVDVSKKKELYDFFLSNQNIKGNKESVFSTLLYYFGGFMSILSISIFMTLTFDHFGKEGLFILSTALFFIGLLSGKILIKKELEKPAGVLVSFSLALVPLIVFTLQHILGFYDSELGNSYSKYHKLIDERWLFMEFSTLVVGAFLLYRYKQPFIMFPVAFTFWYLSMDLAVFFAKEDNYAFELRADFSLFFGLFLTGLAIVVDYFSSREKDFSYWLYIVGVFCFWSGLTFQASDYELGKFLYFVINLLMLILGSLLLRKVFIVFGAMGSVLYFGHLSQLFDGLILFTLASVFGGFFIIYIGIWWSKNGHKINDRLLNKMPKNIQQKLKTLHQ